jgi:hypothetical protein
VLFKMPNAGLAIRKCPIRVEKIFYWNISVKVLERYCHIDPMLG